MDRGNLFSSSETDNMGGCAGGSFKLKKSIKGCRDADES